MNSRFADLAWLPRAPDTFSDSVKALAESARPGRADPGVAQHHLSLNQLIRLGKALAKLRRYLLSGGNLARLQGGGVAINKLWQMMLTGALGKPSYRNLTKKGLYVSAGRGLTFTWFAFILFWFWADWNKIAAIFGSLHPAGWSMVWIVLWGVATLVLAAWEVLHSGLRSARMNGVPLFTHRYMRAAYVSTIAMFAIAISVFLSQAAPDISTRPSDPALDLFANA